MIIQLPLNITTFNHKLCQMPLIDTIKDYNPDEIVEKELPLISLFGKNILLDVRNQLNANTDEKQLKKSIFDSTTQRIRELLRADNFSVLTGAGSSFAVGGVLFSEKELVDGWVSKLFEADDGLKLKSPYISLLGLHKKNNEGQIVGVEDFITFLVKLEYGVKFGTMLKVDEVDVSENIRKVKNIILRGLGQKCKLPVGDKRSQLSFTKTFIKRILSRPVNLRRSNLFTTNYDLVFEKAMDELGVIYVDGFIGGLKKYFHPEAFSFDFYYPAATTEGKVSRLERVLHFYKLHGSLNWKVSKELSYLNAYGIEKTDEELLPDDNNVLIYPTPMKETDTLGFPYSEVFRRFANTIQQPQSVLITFGFSFGDAHINRIIFEALSIPSFQLLIVSYSWSDNIKKIYELFKDEPSVGFIIGEQFASWEVFANQILPDLPSQDLEEKYQAKREKSTNLIVKIDKEDK